MNFKDFLDLGVDSRIIDATEAMGFETPMPVQEQTIPLAVSGCDLLVQAPTGTGKTAAFGIPVINGIDVGNKSVQAVILSPTRELTMQITAELKKLSANVKGLLIASVYGGQNMERQLSVIRKKPHVIVGTTGRVMDHLRRGTLKLHEARVIVLDEADEMLSMGFRDDIDFILKKMPRDMQKLFFSATVPEEIAKLSATYQNDPMVVKTTCEGLELPPIKQYSLAVTEENKYELMRKIIAEKGYGNIIVFCNTKVKVSELNERLNKDFYLSMALHGDMRQRERDRVMKSFRAHEINMLIATDVCARGIDVDGIEAIFNYDVPLDEEYYIHRIGRTARANKSGVAYSFVTGRDKLRLNACEKVAGAKMEPLEIEGLTEKPRPAGQKFGLPTTRFFINVGTRDGASKETVIGYLTGNTPVKSDDVYDVKLKDIYGFIEVDGKYTEEILGLNGAKCFKRKLCVEICTGRAPKDVEKQNREFKDNKRGDKQAFDRQSGRKTYSGKSTARHDNTDKNDGKAEINKKEYGAKKSAKPYEKRENADKKPYVARGNGEKKPYENKDGADKKPYEKRGNPDKKSFENRVNSEKPYKPREKAATNTDKRGDNAVSFAGNKPTKKFVKKPDAAKREAWTDAGETVPVKRNKQEQSDGYQQDKPRSKTKYIADRNGVRVQNNGTKKPSKRVFYHD